MGNITFGLILTFGVTLTRFSQKLNQLEFLLVTTVTKNLKMKS